MNSALRVYLLASMLFMCGARGAVALDIVLDVDGVGSVAITDNLSGDGNPTVGIIDFNETFGGQFQAEGRVEQFFGPIARMLGVGGIPPATDAVFRNTDVLDRDFTLTATSSDFPSPSGPPLGWDLIYNGSADDPAPDVVDIPNHSVELRVNNPEMTLTTVVGTAITTADAIDLGDAGSDFTGVATRSRVVFSLSAGPGDEILLPADSPFFGLGIEARVFNQEHRCIDKMNNRARALVKATGKAVEKCVKTLAGNGGGPSTDCTINLTSTKIDNAEDKILDQFASRCPSVPAWGVNGGTCCENGSNDGAACTMDSPDCDVGGTCLVAACISGAAERAMRDLALDIFGGTALVGVNEVGRCQREIIKAAAKTLETRWKIFRKCKKSNVQLITGDADLISTCLGPPQVDTGKIVNVELKVGAAVDSKCIATGVVPVGSAFPGGACSEEADGNFAACVNARTACRFCQGVNVADDIDPPLDCDLFDDAAANASCP